MNELKMFENLKLGNVRGVEIDGESYLVGKDVVEALGYEKKYVDVIKQHIDEEDYIKVTKETQFQNEKTQNDLPLNGRIQNIEFNYKELGRQGGYLINSNGLFKLITYCEVLAQKEKQEFIEFFIEKGLLDKNIVVLTSRVEIEFLHSLQQVLDPLGLQLKKQYYVDVYKLDAYIASLNIAIEYDETQHETDINTEKDEERQEYIENKLGCKFVRCSIRNTHNHNIGLVVKAIMNK